ncbi:5'-deoxyadenosine deaminase [Artemisia annua]|uniref:5'-deoxyadenosine deaminase n=1 Tax=Artemisia annua TaxID=35608 RepID=A0A2U1LE35_ARTAN|nr:5'-deoxyadenosine deaminase [Artemisia annua]
MSAQVKSFSESKKCLPSSWGIRTCDERMQSQKELHKKHLYIADGRLKIRLGIRQIMKSTDRLLLETRYTAKKLQTGNHMVEGLCKILEQKKETLASLEFVGCKLPAHLVTAICESLHVKGFETNAVANVVSQSRKPASGEENFDLRSLYEWKMP